MRRGKVEPIIWSGLDIGTRKISLIVAETDPLSQDTQVIAVGSSRTRGISKGEIRDADLVVESIRKAVDEAEKAFDLNVRDAFLSIGPTSVSSFILEHKCTLSEEGITERPVTGKDMKDIIREAMKGAREITEDLLLHAIPLAYSVDAGPSVKDPRGALGSELATEVLFIGLAEEEVRRSISCAEKAGLNVLGVIHKSIASAFGSLSVEELEDGAVAVDIGAGTTTVTYARGGQVRGVGVFPGGGDLVTQDISEVLTIPASKAEYLKREVSLFESPEDLGDELEFEMGGEPFVVTVQDVLGIVSPRIEEIFFRFIVPKIEEFEQEGTLSAIVFSGGVAGSKGFMDLASESFETPVRLGEPVKGTSLPPHARGCEFSSTVGIVNYLLERDNNPDNLLEPVFGALAPEEAGMIKTPSPWKGKLVKKENEGKGPMARFFDALRNAFSELF
ncbi:MAG: Cell division protein FtsA [Synergistetes bacterium ADurb.Bin155]|jgi:cell division protein FtsA|nr:cell division protein FtsA [Synergistales bacterium]MBP8995198.1 cell division protein FtsA [Synergistales bacterium]OQB45996.1 MAG: Cell division protein FtsA [Synergistetes bacterium ADurb.Bin155]HOC81560.1 cell division protein FtsA [Synergistales bacterium]